MAQLGFSLDLNFAIIVDPNPMEKYGLDQKGERWRVMVLTYSALKLVEVNSRINYNYLTLPPPIILLIIQNKVSSLRCLIVLAQLIVMHNNRLLHYICSHY